MAASQRGEVNKGDEAGAARTSDATPTADAMLSQDAMWRGHGGWEMALAPVLFGLFGWWLDGRLGTSPLLVIVLATFGLVGSVANQYYQYRYRMDQLAEERRAARAADAGAAA